MEIHYSHTMYLNIDEDASHQPRPKQKFQLIFAGSLFLLVALILNIGNDSFDQRSLLASATFSHIAGELRSSEAPVPEAPELVLVGGTGIQAAVPPLTVTPQVLGAVIGQVDSDIAPELLNYLVEEGDTIASVAERFGKQGTTGKRGCGYRG